MVRELQTADAGVPYRTSVYVAQRYDAWAVAEALARDFAANGAPLVWRVDRWKAHQTKQVREVLEANGVLLLHGPPRHPRFYGQLERQNREHRAWFEAGQGEAGEGLRESCERMVWAFNELVPRRTLRWLTAGEVWRARTEVAVDRRELRDDVEEHQQVTASPLRRSRTGFSGLRSVVSFADPLPRRAADGTLTTPGDVECGAGSATRWWKHPPRLLLGTHDDEGVLEGSRT